MFDSDFVIHLTRAIYRKKMSYCLILINKTWLQDVDATFFGIDGKLSYFPGSV